MGKTELHKYLESVGLSEKEARCYFLLLEYGTQPTSFIAKKASLNRGTTYVALHSLLEKGFALKSEKRKTQLFSAIEPERIEELLARKATELNRQQERFHALLEDFNSIRSPFSAMPKIRYFEGVEGARNALEDTLQSEETLLRAFLSIVDISDFLGADYFDDYTERRIKSGRELRVIRTLEKDKQAYAKYNQQFTASKQANRLVGFIDDELAFPVNIYIYGNKLGIISSKEENYALIIESAEVAKMQATLFETLWQKAVIEDQGMLKD